MLVQIANCFNEHFGLTAHSTINTLFGAVCDSAQLLQGLLLFLQEPFAHRLQLQLPRLLEAFLKGPRLQGHSLRVYDCSSVR